MLELIDAIEENCGEVAGVLVHEIPQDFKPLLFATNMEMDPVFIFLFRAALDRPTLKLQIHRQLLDVEAGNGLDLVEQLARKTQASEVPPGCPTGDCMTRNRSRWSHHGKIQDASRQALPARHRPDGLALDVARVQQADITAIGRLETKKVHNAVIAGTSAGD